MQPLLIMRSDTAIVVVALVIFIAIAVRLLALRHHYAAACKLQRAPLQPTLKLSQIQSATMHLAASKAQ